MYFQVVYFTATFPLRSAHHSDDSGGDVRECHRWYLLLLEPKYLKAWRQSGMYVWISIPLSHSHFYA